MKECYICGYKFRRGETYIFGKYDKIYCYLCIPREENKK